MAFHIVRNDITKIKADAIVNTANPGPVYMDGTDSAIYAAAGAERLLDERRKIGPIEEGDVAVTPAFDLDAEFIFHTVAPVWEGGDHGEKETVRKCYINCLNKAVELGLESIAFPLIATGVNGFPKADALLIATSVFSAFLAENELDITLAVFDSESFRLSDRIFAGVDQFIDDNYVEEKTEEEYSGSFICEDRSVPFLAEPECAEEEPESGPWQDGRHHEISNSGLAGSGVRLSDGRRDNSRDRRRARGNFLASQSKQASMLECMGAAPALEAKAALAGPKPRSLDDVVKNVSETWSESLLRMITEKGYSDTEVYKRANVDRKLFSKIRSNKNYQPKKNTAVAFALALKLNVDETKDFLMKAGYAFSPSSRADLIVEYFIGQNVYDLMLINLALFEHGQPLLGE